MATMFERMKGAALLDIQTYEEVEANESLIGEAAVVVLCASLAHGIGSLGFGAGVALGVVVYGLIGWLLWAGVTYLIGVHLFKGTATWGELLRTIGFAHAPGLLFVVAILPIIGSLISFVVMLWMLVCGVIAIRQALDFSTGQAVLTALLGWLVLLIPSAILSQMMLVSV